MGVLVVLNKRSIKHTTLYIYTQVLKFLYYIQPFRGLVDRLYFILLSEFDFF